jgi:predicted metal-dependent hydrolase
MIKSETLSKIIGLSESEAEFLTVRHSPRASRLILNFSPQDGVVIVLPKYYEDKWVNNSVVSKKSWIQKRIRKLISERSNLRPDNICLQALDFERSINYRDNEGLMTIDEEQEGIIVSGDIKNEILVSLVLQEWLQRFSSEYLIPTVESAADQYGFIVDKIRVKYLKTIWGSCSINKNISLNRNLLFFPTEIVNYVIYHELTHLKVMDHSPKFWVELQKILPKAQSLRRQLREQERTLVPVWANIKPLPQR